MTALFVDTGALVGRVLPRDQHHRNSRNGWEMLKNIPVKLFSSEHVLDEAVSRLSRQAGADYAVRWGREHLASREIEWLNTTPADWQEALLSLDKFSDKN